MYTGGMGAGAAVTTTTAVVLPNTGSSMLISISLAIGAGLIVWGVMYARSTRATR